MTQPTLFLDPPPQEKAAKYSPLAVVRKTIDGESGWWIYAEPISPDVPFWGPWPTRGQATEVRNSYRRNAINKFPRWRVVTGRRSKR
jgi:hypothetical protein